MPSTTSSPSPSSSPLWSLSSLCATRWSVTYFGFNMSSSSKCPPSYHSPPKTIHITVCPITICQLRTGPGLQKLVSQEQSVSALQVRNEPPWLLGLVTCPHNLTSFCREPNIWQVTIGQTTLHCIEAAPPSTNDLCTERALNMTIPHTKK